MKFFSALNIGDFQSFRKISKKLRRYREGNYVTSKDPFSNDRIFTATFEQWYHELSRNYDGIIKQMGPMDIGTLVS